jgi:thiamine biosynthesis lipoprotein
VAIEHPEATAPLALIGIGGGGVATSSTLRRTWRRGEQRLHHLIDPSTQQPSATDLELASVVAGAAWRAEVLAKAVLLRGTARAFDLLDASTAALIVGTDGAVLTTESFLAFTGGATVAATVERVRPVAS